MKQLLILIFITYCSNVFSQINIDTKRDYTWLLGYGNGEKSILRFSNNSLSVDTTHSDIWLNNMNSTISDTSGNLLFYTNGFKVMDKNYLLMENGDSLNCCLGYFSAGMQTGYGAFQGAIILTNPSNQYLYYILHINADITSSAPYFQHSSVLYYSLVDMSYNNGLGKVVQKNIPLLSDTLNIGMLNACRHANGRDWLMLIREYESNRYHRFLISPNGIEEIGIQTVGNPIPQYSFGQTIFSPDGTRFALVQTDPANYQLMHYSVYDFDRCTGLLSNHITDTLPNGGAPTGIAFSPNNRYLYLSSAIALHQFDMQNVDWQATQQTIAEWSAWQDSAGNTYTFGYMALAPDNKIYMGAVGKYLNVIHSPDSAGAACNFTHHSIKVAHVGRSMPNFPHFRLGALVGSGCDTIGTTSLTLTAPLEATIKVYPNPAKEKMYLSTENRYSTVYLSIEDVLGKEVATDVWQNTRIEKELTLTALPQGVYYLRILAGEKRFTYKIMKE